MKTILLDDVLSERELYFVYNEITRAPNCSVATTSDIVKYPSNKQFAGGAMFSVKRVDGTVLNYPLYFWGQTLVHRIVKILEQKNIGMHTKLKRMWFLSTTNGSPLHFLHPDTDGDQNNNHSILFFMTPVWKTGWRGSFYVDGEEFKFKPGSAVIFDSAEYHTGEDPISETYNWQRITLNMVVEK